MEEVSYIVKKKNGVVEVKMIAGNMDQKDLIIAEVVVVVMVMVMIVVFEDVFVEWVFLSWKKMNEVLKNSLCYLI